MTEHDWLTKGLSAQAAGRFEEALFAFERAIDRDGTNARAWIERGEVLTSLGRHTDALASYDHAIAHEPQRARAWYGKGRSLTKLGRIDEAKAVLGAFAEMAPSDDPKAIRARAWLAEVAKRSSPSIAPPTMVSSVPAPPPTIVSSVPPPSKCDSRSRTLALLRRAEHAREVGDPTGALALADQAVSTMDDLWAAHAERTTSLLELGRFEDALLAAETATRLAPTQSNAWFLRGRALEMLKRNRAAVGVYAKATDLDAANADAWFHLGTCQARLRRLTDAVSSLDRALALRPGHPHAARTRNAVLAEQRATAAGPQQPEGFRP